MILYYKLFFRYVNFPMLNIFKNDPSLELKPLLFYTIFFFVFLIQLIFEKTWILNISLTLIILYIILRICFIAIIFIISSILDKDMYDSFSENTKKSFHDVIRKTPKPIIHIFQFSFIFIAYASEMTIVAVMLVFLYICDRFVLAGLAATLQDLVKKQLTDE